MEPGEHLKEMLGTIPPERIATATIRRPPPALVAGYLELANMTSTVSDVLDLFGIDRTIPASVLAPLDPRARVAGPAITLRYVPELTTMTEGYCRLAKAKLADRDAYLLAQPGDVLIIDAGGNAAVSCMGNLSASWASRQGLAGTVVDGAIRDVNSVRSIGYPVWSRGATPRSGKLRIEAAEINGIIHCAGTQVRPGDLVLADGDGIVIVPVEHAEEVLIRAKAASEIENNIESAIRRGASIAEMKQILPFDRW